MEFAAIFGAVKGCPCPRQARNPSPIRKHPTQILLSRNRVNNKKLSSRTFAAVAEASSVISDPTQVEITWQIVVGTLAGVTPFVVAGIEFSKRIVQQRICGECNGSGLILKGSKSYIRCPSCGRIRCPFLLPFSEEYFCHGPGSLDLMVDFYRGSRGDDSLLANAHSQDD